MIRRSTPLAEGATAPPGTDRARGDELCRVRQGHRAARSEIQPEGRRTMTAREPRGRGVVEGARFDT